MQRTGMCRLAKELARWTVPRGFHDLAREWLISKRASSDGQLSDEERQVLDRNRELHNRHRGERCFILATGPSIKTQNLTPLRNETCIAVSNFFVHPDYLTIRPQYYCVAPYHLPITEEGWQTWMAEIAAGTAEATLLFWLADRERNGGDGRFRRRNVHHLAAGGAWDDLLANGVDLTRAVPGPASVPVMALMLGIYMGFTDVYLLGCDHDWILHLNESRHFYEESESALKRADYDEWSGTDLESQCRDYVGLWQQYKFIRRLTLGAGVHVYNATRGGLLDVFPRVDLDVVLGSSAMTAGLGANG